MTQKTNGIVADIMVLGDVEAQMGSSAGLEAEGVETPKADDGELQKLSQSLVKTVGEVKAQL